jgi:4-hydroxy-2-oxoheptanedioate aldolase
MKPHTPVRWTIVAVVVAATLAWPAVDVAAQQRLNGTIEVIADGGAAFGIFSGDRSLDNARSLSRSDLDFIFFDMEHGPFDVETLRLFLLGMTDKGAIASTGSLRMNTTPIVRIPATDPNGREWMTKQVLDVGAFGVIFPMVSTREEAERAVAAMRYPPTQGDPQPEPRGRRGRAPGNAVWYWGVGYLEYLQKADVWPLDPNGELLAVIQIESRQAVRNIEDIIGVPGVGAIFVGPSDLSADFGLAPTDPQVEQAIQAVLRSCIDHDIPCGITTGPHDVEKRIDQGFRFVTVGGDSGISPGTAEALRIGREAAGRGD